MVFSDYTKRRILLLRERGKRTKEISELLLKEDIRASHRGISKFLSRYKQRGTIVRKKGSGCAAKINEVIKARIEEHMANDDEMTAKQLGELLANERHTLKARKNTLRCRDRLIYITYRLFTVERTVNLHRLIYHLNAPCRFSHIACSCNGKIVFFN